MGQKQHGQYIYERLYVRGRSALVRYALPFCSRCLLATTDTFELLDFTGTVLCRVHQTRVIVGHLCLNLCLKGINES